MSPANRHDGVTLRQAALIAGFAYLLNPVTLAEFSFYPKLVIPGHIDQTVQNIVAHGGMFVAAIFCYLISFIGDVVIAWALYVLLAPVNRSVSRLTAWFRLMYTAVALVGLLNLVAVYRLLHEPGYSAAFGSGPLHAQVELLLNAFRWDWSIGLIFFGIHLGLLGCLIYRSGYIPRILGIALVIDGAGWLTDSMQPYLFPSAHLGLLLITFSGELFFMLWLLIRGWTVREPRPRIPEIHDQRRAPRPPSRSRISSERSERATRTLALHRRARSRGPRGRPRTRDIATAAALRTD